MSSAERSICIAARSGLLRPLARLVERVARGARRRRRRARRAARGGNQVGVAPDRRGEVAVALALEPGVAEVARRVVGLLERPQHQRGERGRALALAAPDLRATIWLTSPTSSPACWGDICSGTGGVGTSSVASLSTSARHRRGLGPLVHAVERRRAAVGQVSRHLLVGQHHQLLDQLGATRSAPLASTPTTPPRSSNSKLRLGLRLDRQRAAPRRAAPPARRPRRGPRSAARPRAPRPSRAGSKTAIDLPRRSGACRERISER